MRRILLPLLLAATPLAAQQFTTAAEVKPILTATKANWIAVREYEGQDLLYFTQILSWRCGLIEIMYSVNGADPVRYEAEPCYEDEAQPNALKMEGTLPYVALPLGSVETVGISLVFDDGSTDGAMFDRAGVQIN